GSPSSTRAPASDWPVSSTGPASSCSPARSWPPCSPRRAGGSDMAWLRLFQSAVDPSDVDEVQRLFNDDVRPVFAGIAACESMELIVSTESSAGGLVEGCALSRWTSLDALEQAVASRE